jgi:nucleotide-binding universal stress UspA family protein
MFKHLLVPLDGTPMAEAAVTVASFLAGRTGARVTLLHVIESGASDTVHGQPHLVGPEEAEEYLKVLAARSFPEGVKVDWHVHRTAIRDVARSLAAHIGVYEPDLLVMCAHGSDRLRNLLYGNLAQQTLKLGRTPVLILKSCRAEGPPFSRLLAPLDGDREHEQGLPAALALAGLCNADLQLLFVVPTPGSLPGEEAAAGSLMPRATREILSLETEEAVRYLEEIVQRCSQEGIETRGAVSSGDPVAEIVRMTESLPADLVVLGTHGKAGTRAFWSASVASRLVARLEASVLLVPAQAAE